MSLSLSDQISMQHKFDAFCKKVVKYEMLDAYREMKRRRDREVSFDELPTDAMPQLSTNDQYPVEHYSLSRRTSPGFLLGAEADDMVQSGKKTEIKATTQRKKD